MSCFNNFLSDYIGYLFALATIIIAVIGWIVQHRNQIKANNRNFINNIKNQARIEILNNFISKEDWLSQISFLGHKIPLVIKGYTHFGDFFEELKKISDSKLNTADWIFILENYEVLFPKLKELRKDMVKIDVDFIDIFYKTVSKCFDLIGRPEDEQEIFLNNIFDKYKLGDIALDFKLLLNDIKVYIQNDVLGYITKQKAEMRIPKDLSLPYVSEENGKLIIKNYNNFLDNIKNFKEYLDKSST